MDSDLFESIIRTSGADTNDFNSEEDNFWAPVPVIEQMFEQVLREITQKIYGLFNKKNYNEKAVYFDPYINNVLSFKSRNRKYWDTHDILPCNFEGIAVFRTEEEIKSFKADMFDDIMRYYRNNDPFTKIIGKVFNHSVQNLNLDYNQGKRTANNAMEIKTINVENQEEA